MLQNLVINKNKLIRGNIFRKNNVKLIHFQFRVVASIVTLEYYQESR